MYGFVVGRRDRDRQMPPPPPPSRSCWGRAKTAERVAVPSVKSYQLGRKRTVEFRVGFSNHFMQK